MYDCMFIFPCYLNQFLSRSPADVCGISCYIVIYTPLHTVSEGTAKYPKSLVRKTVVKLGFFPYFVVIWKRKYYRLKIEKLKQLIINNIMVTINNNEKKKRSIQNFLLFWIIKQLSRSKKLKGKLVEFPFFYTLYIPFFILSISNISNLRCERLVQDQISFWALSSHTP